MGKKTIKAPPAPRPRGRTGGSFVWKLTFRQTVRMMGVLFAVDVLLVMLYIGALFAVTEQAAAQAAGAREGSPAAAPSVLSPGMRVLHGQTPMRGFSLPHNVELDLGSLPDTLREFRMEPADVAYPWGASRPEYVISIPENGDGSYLSVIFDLSGSLYRLLVVLAVLLCAEVLLVLFSSAGTRRSVRHTLAPIQALADTARTISVEPVRGGQGGGELQLSGTIETLNAITARRLDTRIAIADEREELRGLASAINNMLDRLDAAYKSQLRFVSDASHELRTPIAVIQGYANLLDRWGKDDPEALQESIGAIKAEAAGMQALVEQLLFLARSDNDSIPMALEVLDISRLVSEVLRDSQLIDDAHPYFSDIAPGLRVLGDGGLLKQALRIFMDNAIKYTPPGERIQMSAWKDGRRVRVSVTDNGIGIPEQDIPHVLERFFRSDESRARKTGGTGLGLAIAKWTIERHGGYVEILSRKDVGTKLTMVLPEAEPQDASQQEPKAL